MWSSRVGHFSHTGLMYKYGQEGHVPIRFCFLLRRIVGLFRERKEYCRIRRLMARRCCISQAVSRVHAAEGKEMHDVAGVVDFSPVSVFRSRSTREA